MTRDLFPLAALRAVTARSWLILLLLPCLHLVSLLVLRAHAGPFWMWSNLDPDYWYLLDSLNMINLHWPVHIAHPGTPVQLLGAVLIRIIHPLSSADQITDLVLANPETYLHLISAVLIVVNTAALVFVGLCGYLLFNDRLAVVLLQLAPFISTLSIKWLTHVAPEPLLITVVLILGGVALLALRPGSLAQNRLTYALVFGLLAGFGMATKITSVGIYFLPVFLLWSPRALATYAAAGLVSMLLFTLPAAGSYGAFMDHLTAIFGGGAALGDIEKPVMDIADYSRQLLRVSSRPAFFVVFFVSLSLIGYLGFQAKFRARPFPLAARLLAGLCLADLVQALIVAKHPSGHYMIPVLVLSALGITLIYRTLMETMAASNSSSRPVYGIFGLVGAGLIVAQSLAMVKLDRQFVERATVATSLNDDRFDKCARIYFWSAASPSYALQLGSHMVGNPFAEALTRSRPANDYWFEIMGKEFRNWSGPQDIEKIAASRPCLYARGYYPGHILPTLKALLPNHSFSRECSPGGDHETLLTSGVNCQGDLE
ncbi:MAG: hypothetical protein HQ483_15095 [Rhodospirillales bacterium]|nr:hypothetical protein [Rhodospirillales bacterium]